MIVLGRVTLAPVCMRLSDEISSWLSRHEPVCCM